MVYYNIIRGVQDKFNTRLQMVRLVEQKGISEVARLYKTTRNTSCKWTNRYRKEGLKGLKDRSRAPKHIPHKTSKEIEEQVITLRKNHPAWDTRGSKCIIYRECREEEREECFY